MSPNDWNDSNANVWNVNGSDNPGNLNNNNVQNDNGVRPAISLSSCVKVFGTGTSNDPYVVEYDNSCINSSYD